MDTRYIVANELSHHDNCGHRHKTIKTADQCMEASGIWSGVRVIAIDGDTPRRLTESEQAEWLAI